MEKSQSSLFSSYPSPFPLIRAAAATVLCCLFALWAVRSSSSRILRKARSKNTDAGGAMKKPCGCSCSCGGAANGSVGDRYERGARPAASSALVERQTGASMMEQLLPEITTHALSYLDYPSLCPLSMTNSCMRKAANDIVLGKLSIKEKLPNLGKSGGIRLRCNRGILLQRHFSLNVFVFIKLAFIINEDFNEEQDSVTPPNGWKSYYAATKAVVNVNAEFYRIIKERSLTAMSRLWLRADYVNCLHGSGEFFSGYLAVMQSWARAFGWGPAVSFEIDDVCARVLPDVAWVTMEACVDTDGRPFHVTSVYEFHNGQWYMVHHHSSVMTIYGEFRLQNVMIG